jgi:hypothetical protein
MKKTLLLIAVLCTVSSAANAWGWGGRHRPPYRSVTPVSAPEINPATAGSALTLLLGGLAVLRGRVGKKK